MNKKRHPPGGILDTEFHKFQNLIYKSSGIRFNESNRSSLETRISERVRATKCTNGDQYYKLVENNSEELKLLLSAITTNLTRFFRTASHFKALQKLVLPNLIAYKENLTPKKKPIMVWSAGCATGEEAYTLAMCLSEWLPAKFHFRIIASDISLPSLYTAQTGIYSEERCEDIPPEFLKKYLYKDKKRYFFKESLKEKILFDYNNLMLNAHYKKFDIVFCRNVMIYFDKKSQKILMDNIYDSMNEYSYLFLGHTESLESIYKVLPPSIQETTYVTVYQRDSR